MTIEEKADVRAQALDLFAKAGITLTDREIAALEIADFGLGDIHTFGLQLVTYINTARVCAKEMALLPGQICPKHRHPPINGRPGKEETFRCRWGIVYLYVAGDPSPAPALHPPNGRCRSFTAAREIRLSPGEQYTIFPDTLHWFGAGEQGAVVSEFSTHSADEYDVFTDPAVRRIPTEEE